MTITNSNALWSTKEVWDGMKEAWLQNLETSLEGMALNSQSHPISSKGAIKKMLYKVNKKHKEEAALLHRFNKRTNER